MHRSHKRFRTKSHKSNSSAAEIMSIHHLPLRCTNHTLSQWALRAKFPEMLSKEAIDVFLADCQSRGRIEHIFKDFYLLDGDIVLVIIQDRGLAIVKTVYGRCSLNSFLYNIDVWAKNRHKYGHMDLSAMVN